MGTGRDLLAGWITANNVNGVRYLLQADLKINEPVGDKGWTFLHLAAYYDRLQVAALLIAKGADVNAKAASGETPLAIALSQESEQVADLLRTHGAR